MAEENKTIDLNKVVVVDKDALALLIAQQAGQLGAGTLNQNVGAGNSSSVVESLAKLITQGRSDEDVNGVETIRAMMPAWVFNHKLATGVELGKFIDSQLQSTVAAWNGISQSNLQNLAAIAHAKELNASNTAAYTRNQVLAEKTIAGVVTEPNYFNEGAPAQQDTPGEGSDPGLDALASASAALDAFAVHLDALKDSLGE